MTVGDGLARYDVPDLPRHKFEWLPDADCWQDFAVCKDAGPSVFFSNVEQDIAVARLTCSECPVQDPCRDEGDRVRDFESFRAGETPWERKRRWRSVGIRY